MKPTPILLFFLMFFCTFTLLGCYRKSAANSDSVSLSQPQFTIRAGVQCVYYPDGNIKSYFDIVLGKVFSGRLPDDIDTITVTGPEGVLNVSKRDFRYYPNSRVFWLMTPGKPQLGSYTFTVKIGDRQVSASDIQSENKKLLLAKPDTYLPAKGAVIRANETNFSWGGGIYYRVRNEIPSFYQLRIYELNGNRVYSSRFLRNAYSERIPDGVLKPGTEYQYQIRVADNSNWIAIQNLSTSPRIPFRTAESLKYKYRIPEQTGDGLPVSSLNEAKINRQKIEHLMADLLHQKIKNIHSLLLVRNGKLVLEEYFQGYTRERKHLTASMAKSITSILVGIAIDQKAIGNVNQKVYAFFPEHNGTRWVDQKYPISLKHILNMAAGTNWDEITYLHPHPKNSNTGLYTSEIPIVHILNHKLIAAPGTIWNYNSGLTVLLGGIIRNTTGLYADKFAEKTLFHPLGIFDHHWFRHSDQTVFVHGDLLLRPRDMAKIGHLILNAGQWKGKQIVSKKWVRESTRGIMATGRGYLYGYQWRSGTIRKGRQEVEGFWASGMGGQKIYVIPKLDLVVVMTSQIYNNISGHDRNESILSSYILPAVLPPAPARKIITLSPESIDSLTGKYKVSKTNGKMPAFVKKMIISITRSDSDLFIKIPGGETTKLYPISPDRLFFKVEGVGEYQIKLIRNEQGEVKQAIRTIGFRSVKLEKID